MSDTGKQLCILQGYLQISEPIISVLKLVPIRREEMRMENEDEGNFTRARARVFSD